MQGLLFKNPTAGWTLYLALLLPKHGPNIGLLIGSAWILIIGSGMLHVKFQIPSNYIDRYFQLFDSVSNSVSTSVTGLGCRVMQS